MVLCLILSLGCAKNSSDHDIAQYLPLDTEIDNWSAIDTVSTFIGQDLFLLINGGAEIYHENGFVQVVSQSFENAAGNQISIEFYEMNSIVGAKKMYESKISDNGEKLAIGDDATLNGYYLNLYKKNFLLTLVGYDSEAATIEGLKKIAEIVSGKIRRLLLSANS